MEGMLERYQEGFTLVELVIVTVIIAIIGGILYQIIVTSTDAWVFLSSRQEMVQDGRVAMLRMVREIREAETILAAERRELRFSNPHDEGIAYRWSGSSSDPLERALGRGFGQWWWWWWWWDFYPLATNVQDLEFEYWSEGGTSPMSPPGTNPDLIDDISRIVIKLGLRKDDESFYLESQVHPRNF